MTFFSPLLLHYPLPSVCKLSLLDRLGVVVFFCVYAPDPIHGHHKMGQVCVGFDVRFVCLCFFLIHVSHLFCSHAFRV